MSLVYVLADLYNWY